MQAERLSVMLAITGHARWSASVLASYVRMARETGVADIARREDELFRRLITADGYPALRAAVDAGVFLEASDPFAFGLARLLDGVAAYLASGARDAPAPWVETEAPAVAADRRVREARKAVRAAEKVLRETRRAERQIVREAQERARRASEG